MLTPSILRRPLPWLAVALLGLGLTRVGIQQPLSGEVPPFSYGLLLTGGPTLDPLRVFTPLPDGLQERLRSKIGRDVLMLGGDVVAQVKVRVPLWPGLRERPPAARNSPPAGEASTVPAEVLVVRIPSARWPRRFHGLLSQETPSPSSGPLLVCGAGMGERIELDSLARSLGWEKLPRRRWPRATLQPRGRLLRSLVFVNDAALPPERIPPGDRPNLLLVTPRTPQRLDPLIRAVQATVEPLEEVHIQALGTRLPLGALMWLWGGHGLMLLGGGLLVMSLLLSYADELETEGWLARQWHTCASHLAERWGLYLVILVWMTLLFQGLQLLAHCMPDLHDHLALLISQATPDFLGATALNHLKFLTVFVFAPSILIPSVGVLGSLAYVSQALWLAPINDLPLRDLLLQTGSVILELHVYVVATVAACCVLEGLFAPYHFDVFERGAGYVEGVQTMLRFFWLIALLSFFLTGYEAIGTFLKGASIHF